jgi:hypothetical protein
VRKLLCKANCANKGVKFSRLLGRASSREFPTNVVRGVVVKEDTRSRGVKERGVSEVKVSDIGRRKGEGDVVGGPRKCRESVGPDERVTGAFMKP